MISIRCLQHRSLVLLPALAALSLSGCASLWDDITSREFKVKNLFVSPDPMVVLRESTDGDKRSRAILALHEPRAHGGGDMEQNTILEILNQAATTDKQPLVRLTAVRQLGTFKDERAVPILEDAFYKAVDFGPSTATQIQCQVLTAMGESRNPKVRGFLVDKLREPPAERSDLAQQRTDRCLAAARALSKFKDDREAAEALYKVFGDSKEDVALRDRAHLALQDVTGEYLPAEQAVWDRYLHPRPGEPVPHRSKLMELVSWITPGGKEEPLPVMPSPGTQAQPAQDAQAPMPRNLPPINGTAQPMLQPPAPPAGTQMPPPAR